MTIAAGFVHRDGILLCSDTQQESGTGKFHGPKVGVGSIPFGKIAFALAGHAHFATTAVQSCVARLAETAPADTLRVLAEVIESEYRRLVFTHPCFETDPDLAYWLLMVLWEQSSNTCSLWATQEHSIHSCHEPFYAVGTGTDLANLILRPFGNDDLSEQETLTLMAYMMARAKDTVSGCGGISQYIAIGNDGTASPLINISLEHVELVAADYDKAAHKLLLYMNDDDGEQFNQALAGFGHQARAIREYWQKIRRSNPEVRQYLGLTTADPSLPPASQE